MLPVSAAAVPTYSTSRRTHRVQTTLECGRGVGPIVLHASDTQAAAALADAERLQRTAATGEVDALRADAERRAKAFNTAVAAAVGRINASLEADRANLEAR
jgi:hypothetical protein